MAAYCIALFLVFDFAWSSFTQGQEQARVARIYDPVYDHGFAANFDGYDVWGEARYRLITDSLGFKDASTRDVPLKSASRRILLIGDSFTEGIGQPFENTFAGLLAQEGAKRSSKVEFLNAGVASYSPTIYYAKIKYLLDKGLQFDEVVLFSDSSDVEDEASSYFCIDEDPKYRTYCNTPPGDGAAARDQTRFLHRPFRRHQPRPPDRQALAPDAGSATSVRPSTTITTGSAGPPPIPIRRNIARSASTAASRARLPT